MPRTWMSPSTLPRAFPQAVGVPWKSGQWSRSRACPRMLPLRYTRPSPRKYEHAIQGTQGEKEMSKVRVLVGTRKGAFVLTSDGKRERWDVSGPHFGGWEIYHLKGSPVDPNRLYVSQTSGWFGQQIQRSN